MKPTVWWSRIGLALAGGLVAFGLAEGALRVVGYGNEYPDARPPEYRRVYDPFRGFALQPHQRIHWSAPCFDVKNITTNSFGMRDRERQLEKQGPRVALLGDSFLRAFEVQNDETLNHLLEADMPGVEFLNFGESGYGTVQSYETYARLAAQFKPDAVVYFMYTNDVIDNHAMLRAWRGGTPGAVEPGFDNYPDLVRADDGAWTFVQPKDQMTLRPSWKAKQWLRQHLRTYVLATRARDGLLRRANAGQSAAQAAAFPAAEGVPYPREWMELAAYGPPANQYWEEAWQVSEHALVELAQAVQRDGSRFAVVLVPTKELFRIDELGFTQATGLPRPSSFDPSYLHERIAQALAAEGVPVIDLRPAYTHVAKDASAAPLSFYHTCNIHWSPLGHRVTAQLVETWLRDELRWPIPSAHAASAEGKSDG